jgi:low temperature requirement protein LtrA
MASDGAATACARQLMPRVMPDALPAPHRQAIRHARSRGPMAARSPHEPHRAATPLELSFDLVFVVAIVQASGELHHAVAEAHALEGLIGYLMVFFAIWWAWMNVTWFASTARREPTA